MPVSAPYNAYCRLYQFAFRIGMYFLPWRRPELISMDEAATVLNKNGVSGVLVVTDAGIVSRGLHKAIIDRLEESKIPFQVYDGTTPNPTIANIEEALALYHKYQLNGIIAVGGGSPMDCAKGVGARVARPKKSITHMRGQLRILKRMPTFIAVPTTAGSGSETTLAAVVTNEKTLEKYAVNDPSLIPHYAVHDPNITVGLPPFITATTGVDALVHAVEAYIGGSNTAQTRKDALAATKLIFENLYEAYCDGTNIKARENMQKAAYLAGAAFTRAYVGNIHAVAHTLGGHYKTPHGLANAVIMPYVLDAYGPRVYKWLAELSAAAGLCGKQTPQKDAALLFIQKVRELNRKMNIPEKLSDLRREDIPILIPQALREANPLYPVPVIFDEKDMEAIYLKILEEKRVYS